jgi:SulP family sulfate permease
MNIAQKIALNWKSGVTVALVSIPLSVSLAIASNATPVAGIITAIWAGLFASFFGGSNYNVIGPTGALSGLLASYTLVYGIQLMPTITVLTGIFIFVAYFLRLERYLVFVPASTIHGFTLGVALIIALNQLNFAIGISGLPIHKHFFANVFESLCHMHEGSIITFVVFVIFLCTLFIMQKVMPRVPSIIVLTPIGIALGYLSMKGWVPLHLTTLANKYDNLHFTLFMLPKFYWNWSTIIPAFTVACIAILETMLSARIADGMTKTKHNERKEMVGLGLANIASAIAGGIPATAALARTALNINTGAHHKMSATISSICIAIISLGFLSYFQFLPLAVIAAILVFVAMRMIEAEHFMRMFKIDKKSFVISLMVAFVTVYEDPIMGILLGTVLTLLIFMDKLSRGPFELIMGEHRITGEKLQIKYTADTLVYSMKGQLAYINAQAHMTRFMYELPTHKQIIFRLRELSFIDLDGVDALSEMIDLALAQNKEVFISGVNPLINSMLAESEQFKKLQKKGCVFERTSQVIAAIGKKLN